MLIHDHFSSFLKWHLKNDRVNWKKWWKMTKKRHLIKIILKLPPGKKKLIRPDVLKREWMWKWKQLLLFISVYTRRKKIWSNFTIKKLELDSSNLFNHAKTINTESFIEALEGERCLRNVNSLIYKNLYEKAKSRIFSRTVYYHP